MKGVYIPHINDLTANNVWEGNNGEKWVAGKGTQSPDKIMVELTRLEVVERLEKIITE